MAQYTLTETEYKEFQKEVVETVILTLPRLEDIITIEDMPWKSQSVWNKANLPSTDIEMWSEFDHALQVESPISFTPTTDKVYRLQSVVRIPVAVLRASRTSGESLDTSTVSSVTRILARELEAFVFQGPIINGNRISSVGLVNQAGNESTFTTTTWGSASGPYETVRDMKGQLLADGFGTGKLDLIVDTTLAPYLWKLPATDANFSEGERIKQQLLNGGDIYVTPQLPSPTANDGVCLLVENNPKHYKLRTPKRLGLSDIETWTYDPYTDSLVGRVEGYFVLHVYQPNAICKHTQVDIA